MNAMQKLTEAWAGGLHLCVGLDLDPEKLPESLLPDKSTYIRLLAFAEAIVMSTSDLAAAYKPNLQYFLGLEAHGVNGIQLLRQVMETVQRIAPNALRVLDCKFGDVGDSNVQSAKFVFDAMRADAVTVSPYVGGAALSPLFRLGKMAFVLARTSNPGAGEFQDRMVAPDQTLYELVAQTVARDWNVVPSLGLVAGATAPQEIRNIRSVASMLPILVPGVGKQGGDLEAAVQAAQFAHGKGGFMLNVSRSLLFASDGADFAQAAQVYAADINCQIQQALGRST